MSRFSINYLYFGLLFFCLAGVHVFHVLLIEPASFATQAVFVVDVILQCLFEVLVLAILSQIIRAFLPSSCFKLFLVAIFLLFVMQMIDFPLVRLMDISVWYAVSLVTEESLGNFIEMLYATNMPLTSWALVFAAILLLPVFGLLLFYISERTTRKKQWELSHRTLGTFFWAIPIFLAVWDFWNVRAVSPQCCENLQKALPLKATLFSPPSELLALGAPLTPVKGEEEILHEIESNPIVSNKKPDIFLFIMESLREDFITEETAPYLSQFRNENFGFDLAYSNANATHISWFSLFYSAFPFYWSEYAPAKWKQGSIPLQILKKMGYKIHVYSSAPLVYYNMDERILGEKCHLADSCDHFVHDSTTPACESDAQALAKLRADMQKNQGDEGHVYIVFLDSTHFDYSWPQDISSDSFHDQEEINYLTVTYSIEGLEGVKNRYRNALHYADALFGNFMVDLNQTPQGRDSVVVVTADHGEEFYEHGHLFHASNLSEEQTHVTLYYKFGQNNDLPTKNLPSLTSHMDIFPTLFHYLFKKELFSSLLQGQSIFRADRWPYVVTGRFNGGRNPSEFFIHNGFHKLLLRFEEQKEIFKSSSLYILSVKDLYDETISYDPTLVQEEFGGALLRLFAP